MRKWEKSCAILMTVVLLITGGFFMQEKRNIKAASVGIENTDFLKTNGKEIKNNYGKGDTIYLRGTNAGGLTVQEFWMCPTNKSDNVHDQYDIWIKLTERFGEDKAKILINTYEDNYWTEKDFDKCASLGMNCIRLPIWYRNFVDSNNNWYSDAFEMVDWFVEEAGKRGMYVVIDMHGAYGSQNGSDHSGVDGGDDKIGATEFFFGDKAEENQEKYYDMWEKIAEHFEGNPIVAGYDLLNEPFSTYRYDSPYSADELHTMLWKVYDKAYDRIREVDNDHIIFMEAVWDSWDLPNPDDYGWKNVVYEYHQYEYSDYDNNNGTQISSMEKKINNIFKSNYNVPSYIGEFCYFNNFDAWDEGLKLLNDNGLSWTSWTYKCVSDYGNWGLMNQNIDKVNIETDSYDTILKKWSNVGTSYDNTNLQNVFKKYTPGVISHEDDITTQGTTTNTATTVEPTTEPETTVNIQDVVTTTMSGKYFITCKEKVVCAEDTGSEPLVANRDNCSGAWESFQIVDNGDGTVSFKSMANNKYVCAVIDEQEQLLARSNKISSWEKFYLVPVADNQYGIISKANSKYVKADFNNDGRLEAKSYSITNSEVFTFYPIETEIIVSDDVKIEGYQISAISEGNRVIGSVEPTINGKQVDSWGLIYGLESVNEFDTGITQDDIILSNNSKYVKAMTSTSEGTLSATVGDSNTATYFARTMKFVAKTAEEFKASYYVRAYAKLQDNTYVYSDVKNYSIYEIADMIYQNKTMGTVESHNYLYMDILSIVNPEYKIIDYSIIDTVVE